MKVLLTVLFSFFMCATLPTMSFAGGPDDHEGDIDDDGDEESDRTTYKVMVEDTWFNDACIPAKNTTMHKSIETIPSFGYVPTSCNDSWATDQNFQFGVRARRIGKRHKLCDRTDYIHTPVALKKGRRGVLNHWDCTPEGVTLNPCLHSDGKVYYKCTAKTNEH